MRNLVWFFCVYLFYLRKDVVNYKVCLEGFGYNCFIKIGGVKIDIVCGEIGSFDKFF